MPTESEPLSYTSSTLQYFLDSIAQRGPGQLLDVGPVYRDNIHFLSHRVGRLYICDLFRCLNEGRKDELPPDELWRVLDYPAETFDGILLWNLVDRLDPPEVKSLVDQCHSMTKPGGFVMIFTLGSQVSSTGQESFVIRNDFELFMYGREYPDIATRQRQNRDFLHLMNPYIPVKSLIYRNGIREFLFQKS